MKTDIEVINAQSELEANHILTKILQTKAIVDPNLQVEDFVYKYLKHKKDYEENGSHQ